MLREIPSGKLRELPNEAAVNVKDRLRDIREFLRAHRHDRLRGGRAPAGMPGPAGQIGELLGHAASVVDDTLTLAESLSTTLLPLPDGEPACCRPLAVYFPAGAGASWRGERTFRHDMYAAAKQASTAFGLETAGLRESAFSSAHSAMRRRHGALLAGLQAAPAAERRQRVAGVLAALTIELRSAVLGENSLRGEKQAEAERFVRRYVPGLLASGMASLSADAPQSPDCSQLALLGTEAREERIAAVLSQASPGDLASLYERLLAHLA
jgi:hypothetical protein